MQETTGRRWRAASALIACLAVLLLAALPPVESLLRTFDEANLDLQLRWRGPEAPPSEVVLLAIDEASLPEGDSWPPPRGLFAETVERLVAAGARTIVFDVLLSEPAEMPPTVLAVLRNLQARGALGADALAEDIEELLDEQHGNDAFRRAMEESRRVVLPFAVTQEPRPGDAAVWLERLRPFALRLAALPSSVEGGISADRLLVPPADLARAAAGIGYAALYLGEDGTLRGHGPALLVAGEPLPSLALEAVRLHRGLAPDAIRVEAGNRLVLGGLELPLLADQGHLIVPYGPEGTFARVRLSELLSGAAPAGVFENAVVVVGLDVLAGGSRLASAFPGGLSGAEALATVVANLLEGRALRRCLSNCWGALAFTAGLTLLGVALTGRGRPILSALLVLGLAGLTLALAQYLLVERDLWIGVAQPLAALLLAAAAVEQRSVALARAARRNLEWRQENLRRFFPPQVAERLASSAGLEDLDRVEQASIMFVDLVGFTAIGERLGPERSMALLRQFHSEVEDVAFAHFGTLVTVMGDGALVCFGVPEPTSRDATEALAGARELLARTAAHETLSSLTVSIGIHRGPVLMGKIGGRRQFQFTVAGDAVNVASRLEQLTRPLGACLVVSEPAMAAAREEGASGLAAFEARRGEVLRGRAEPIDIWVLPRRSGL